MRWFAFWFTCVSLFACSCPCSPVCLFARLFVCLREFLRLIGSVVSCEFAPGLACVCVCLCVCLLVYGIVCSLGVCVFVH